MWSLLGPRPVDVLAFESFSAPWAADAADQLQLPACARSPPSTAACPTSDAVDPAHDLVLAWNGTTSGVRLSDGPWLRRGEGLVICDATSAAFAMDLPWDRLDVVTWSWQKALGGEAAHGMLAMSPRALARLAHHAPPGRCRRSSASRRACSVATRSTRPPCCASRTRWTGCAGPRRRAGCRP